MNTEETLKVEVGTLATTGYGSDCYPAIVTAVSASGKTITVHNVDYIIAVPGLAIGGPAARRASAKLGELILGWPSDDAPGKTYSLRKNGRFYPKGSSIRSGGSIFLGDAIAYQDPSF